MLIYGVGIGIVTVLIRIFGAYPEGVQFAILIFNGFTPLINKYVKPKRFGKEVSTWLKKNPHFMSMVAHPVRWLPWWQPDCWDRFMRLDQGTHPAGRTEKEE